MVAREGPLYNGVRFFRAVDVSHVLAVDCRLMLMIIAWGSFHHGMLFSVAARRLDVINKARRGERLPSKTAGVDNNMPEIVVGEV